MSNRNQRQSAKSADNKTAEPMAFEDIPIGPERTDLAFFAVILRSCGRMHMRTCTEVGNVKAALMNTQHDDPAVMALIEHIITLPLGKQLYAAAEKLYTAATEG